MSRGRRHSRRCKSAAGQRRRVVRCGREIYENPDWFFWGTDWSNVEHVGSSAAGQLHRRPCVGKAWVRVSEERAFARTDSLQDPMTGSLVQLGAAVRMPLMPTHELVLETELSIEECLARLTAQGAPRPPDILRMYRRPYPGTLLYRIRGNHVSLQLADSLLVGEQYSPELRGSMKSVATGTRIDALVGLPRRTIVGARVIWAIWALWAAFLAWQASALPATSR